MEFAFKYSLYFLFVYFCMLFNFSYCFCSKLHNFSFSQFDSNWSPAAATWYGSPNGAGSDGGACGFGNIVGQPPFSSMVSAGGPSLFKGCHGCGACYQVKCTSDVNKACSGNPVIVVITDNCPGGPCASDSVHFDLSGTAFGAMANSGGAEQLRSIGKLTIQYRKVNCNYHGKTMTFHVDSGSTSNYFATLIEYVDGDGELTKVELKQALNSDTWLTMQNLWGALWKLNSASTLRAPFSIRLTVAGTGETVVANNVIPVNWKAGQTYQSLVNFKH
ncbi:putative expansin-B2 [Carica papaya]|uniref:putative expansin-B2 n=1 Tax=Carica papaya TaxID=3649 RepID=UPI000B8CD2C6|nr:putative expansin-B2 [Carica papaya]